MKTASIYAPGEWGTLAQGWRDHLFKSVRQTTVTVRLIVVQRLGVWATGRGYSPRTISAPDIRAYLDQQRGEKGAAVADFHHRSLRMFFAWLVDSGEIEVSPMTAAGSCGDESGVSE
jgi:site-specific recombinase XerD